MHVVTKILIVFGAILSILVSALTISFASNAENIRQSVADETARRVAAEGDLNLARTDNQTKLAEQTRAAQMALDQVARLSSELTSVQNERNALAAREQQAVLRADKAANDAVELRALARTQTDLVKSLTDEITGLRRSSVDAARRETELVDRLNDLESQLQVSRQAQRSLEEQLAEARLAVEAARNPTTTAASALGTESLGPVVRARVVNVFKNQAGEDMAEINVGSAQGIRVGQRMNIVRDGFIAALVVTTVDLQRSAGRIDRLGREVEVRSDDQVLSRLN